MKHLHMHVSVPDLAQSIAFYELRSCAAPSVVKDDYAKWMLEDPRVNFAISVQNRAAGLDHVGIQVDSTAELAELSGRLKAAGAQTFDQQGATCCYAKSDKSELAGVRWKPSTPSARPRPTAEGPRRRSRWKPVRLKPAPAPASACC